MNQNSEKNLRIELLNKGFSSSETEELIEKAKYLRREGTPGNYKYIYDESDKKQDKKHISDMGLKDKIAAAKNLGIKEPENLSPKELNRKLTEANIEKQMKKFKEREL